MSEPPRIIGEVRDYPQLVAALRRYFLEDLRVPFEVIDDIAGLHDRHTNKLLAPRDKPDSRKTRVLGAVSFGAILGAGGLKVLLVVDEAQLAKVRAHSKFRHIAPNAPYGRQGRDTGARHTGAKNRSRAQFAGNSQWGRTMRARQLARMQSDERRAIAKRAIRMRWQAAKRQPRPAVSIAQPSIACATPQQGPDA